jgi:hypothetical protein
MNAVVKSETPLLKLDLGCGPNPREGFTGVDSIKFDNVQVVHDLRKGPWPFEDNSVSEAHCSHFLEHLTNFNDQWERVRFFNELWRIMVPASYDAAGKAVTGFCTLIIPHWNAARYYGDPTHKEPLSEWTWYYLDKNWRAANAPHTDIAHNPNGYSCDWNCYGFHTLHPELQPRNTEYQNFAQKWFRDACQDAIVTMTARKA